MYAYIIILNFDESVKIGSSDNVLKIIDSFACKKKIGIMIISILVKVECWTLY